MADYKGEYYRYHPVIENFWEVFLEFPIDMKKKFLGMLVVYVVVEATYLIFGDHPDSTFLALDT